MESEINGNARDAQFAKNLRMISNKLKEGLSAIELKTIADIPVSGEWRVQDLIEANVRTGYIRYKDGKFTTLVATVGVRLTSDEESILNQKAVETGLSPQELVKEYIIKGLSKN